MMLAFFEFCHRGRGRGGTCSSLFVGTGVPDCPFSVPSAPVAQSRSIPSVHSALPAPCFAVRNFAKTIFNRFHFVSRLEPLCRWQSLFASMTDSSKTKNQPIGWFFVLEVTIGFEPMDNGVADRGLTTWLRHHIKLWARCLLVPIYLERITGLEPATSTLARSRSTK